jgi:hypothetical protein
MATETATMTAMIMTIETKATAPVAAWRECGVGGGGSAEAVLAGTYNNQQLTKRSGGNGNRNDDDDSDDNDDGNKGNGGGSSLARARHWRWRQHGGGVGSSSAAVAAQLIHYYVPWYLHRYLPTSVPHHIVTHSS